MAEGEDQAQWTVADWHGKMVLDRNGEKIGKLQDVYVDVETHEPQFGTVKEGVIDRHLTFVPLVGIEVGPEELKITATKDQVRSAPHLDLHGDELTEADESTLYHHFEMNYAPVDTGGRGRLTRWIDTDWRGKLILGRHGEHLGRLQDIYVDVETHEPTFGTVKEGVIDRHLTFVPLVGIQVGPDSLTVPVTKEQVISAPDIDLQGEQLTQADESALYHHFEMNYTPVDTGGNRLVRR